MAGTPGYRQNLADGARGLCAFLIYLFLAFLFLGRGLIGNSSAGYIGQGPDPQLAIWFMGWIPHAIRHHVNPLFTNLLFAPVGLNILWATSNPLGSLLGSPLTLIEGPLASYNLLCVLSPALAGWSAFVICDYLTGKWWPSLAAGYLFGFSPYILLTIYNGWVDRALVFPVPLAVYVGVRGYDGTLSPWKLTLSLTVIELVQFLFSTEMFLMSCAFGATIALLAIGILDADGRRRIVGMLWPAGFSVLLSLILLSPCIYYVLESGIPKGAIWVANNLANNFDNRPISILFPSKLYEIAHGTGWFAIGRFVDTNALTPAFIGPALSGIFLTYCWGHFQDRATRLLAYSFVFILLLSFGGWIVIGGLAIPNLPGILWNLLPELNKALPSRFSMYYMLAAAIMAALWLADDSVKTAARCGAAFLAISCGLPVFSARFWIHPTDTPAFFSQGLYKRYITPGETVMILPYAYRANTMLWQATTDMYFRMASGHSWPLPYEYARWPIVIAMYKEAYLPDPRVQFMTFLAEHKVNTVIVGNGASDYWWRLANDLNVKPVSVGGVSIYHVSPQQLEAFNGLTPTELERRADAARLSEAMAGAAKFLANNGNLMELNAQQVETQHLLRSDWYGGPDLRISDPVVLTPTADGHIKVGIFGSREALNCVVNNYRYSAMQIRRVPVPSPVNPSLQLIMFVFDRASLAESVAESMKESVHRKALPCTS